MPWARWFGPRAARAVTAVMIGDTCHAARVEAGAPGGRMTLAAVAEGTADDLSRWKGEGLFDRSAPLLVLRHGERHLLTVDRPEVPDAELPLAVRFPLAEAMEAEPDELLSTAVALPRINEAARAQVLAVGSRLQATRDHLARLSAAGVEVRSIDVVDSALRGIALLKGVHADGSVVLAGVGHDICIGLLWKGDFCALRTIALPVRAPRDPGEFEEQLALHIQRTTDHFERQATALAVRRVIACLPSLELATREALRAALPLTVDLFDLDDAMDISALAREHCGTNNDLTALACVAAARLVDTGVQAPVEAAR